MSAFLPKNLRRNPRFYLLVFSFILSIATALILSLMIPSNTLYAIRLQQLYGFLALAFWYVALLASPLKAAFGERGPMAKYLHLRRAIGVSAAYFASLHVLVAFFGQLGGFAGIGSYPSQFGRAMLFGLLGLVFLLVMALTSFDKVVQVMTFKRWKTLHRIGYIAAVLVFLHIWIVGTHLEYAWVRLALFIMLAVLAGLESWRITSAVEKKDPENVNNKLRWVIFSGVFLLIIGMVVILPSFSGSYHNEHVELGSH